MKRKKKNMSSNKKDQRNDDSDSDDSKKKQIIFYLTEDHGHQVKNGKNQNQNQQPKIVEIIELTDMRRASEQAIDQNVAISEEVLRTNDQIVQNLPEVIFEIVYHPIKSALSLLRKVLIPFILSGLAQVLAGLLLNNLISRCEIFKEMPHLVASISPLLGTLSSIKAALSGRLTTEANKGTLDHGLRSANLRSLFLGNLKVVNAQAAVVSLLTALVSLGAASLREDTRKFISWQSALAACSGTVTTSMVVNFFLSTVLGVLVFGVRKCGFNTDSILCSLLVSLIRDLSSLGLLALITSKLHQADAPLWLHALISLSPALLLAPLAGYYALKNNFTRTVIIYCWPPLAMAVLLEAPGGLAAALNFRLHPLASALQPVVNGVALNAISIQAGAVSLNLKAQMQEQSATLMQLDTPLKSMLSPFCSRADINSRIAHLLLSLSLPAQLFNLSLLYILQLHSYYNFYLTAPFIATFVFFVFVQVTFTLEVAHAAVFVCVRLGYNPDTAARPLIAAVCNLSGNCAMAVMFAFLSAVHDDNVVESNFNDIK